MSAKRKPHDHAATIEQTNGAYGLVLGAYLDPESREDWSNSSAGWAAWNDPRIQAAAMRAAQAFLDEIRNTD